MATFPAPTDPVETLGARRAVCRPREITPVLFLPTVAGGKTMFMLS